jgi:beta-mannosidase
VALFPDRLDPAAEVDEMLVTLLPGEIARFLIRSPTRSTTPPCSSSPCSAA